MTAITIETEENEFHGAHRLYRIKSSGATIASLISFFTAIEEAYKTCLASLQEEYGEYKVHFKLAITMSRQGSINDAQSHCMTTKSDIIVTIPANS